MKIKIEKTFYGGRYMWRLLSGDKIECEGYCAYKTFEEAEAGAREMITRIVEAAKEGIEVEE